MNTTRKLDRLTKAFQQYIKRKEKEQIRFDKEQAIKCPQKSANAFYKCSAKFFDGSTLEKRMANIQTCAHKVCTTESKKLKEYWKQYKN